MSNGRGGGGSAKNISGGGGGGADLFGDAVKRLETEIKELKSKIETDSKEISAKIETVKLSLATITGEIMFWKFLIGALITALLGAYAFTYFSTNNLSKDIHRLEIAIISSKPQVPATNSR